MIAPLDISFFILKKKISLFFLRLLLRDFHPVSVSSELIDTTAWVSQNIGALKKFNNFFIFFNIFTQFLHNYQKQNIIYTNQDHNHVVCLISTMSTFLFYH